MSLSHSLPLSLTHSLSLASISMSLAETCLAARRLLPCSCLLGSTLSLLANGPSSQLLQLYQPLESITRDSCRRRGGADHSLGWYKILFITRLATFISSVSLNGSRISVGPDLCFDSRVCYCSQTHNSISMFHSVIETCHSY